MNFQDKVVLVTGASRGIGREIARQWGFIFADLMGWNTAVVQVKMKKPLSL